MSHKLSTGLHHRKGPVSQTGAGLPIALFIITVLSLIVLGMSQLQESSGNAISLQIQSQRAFFAAESGAQVAIADLLKQESEEAAIDCAADGEEIFASGFDASGLNGCEVTVDCQGGEKVITITSEGNCGATDSPDHARRTVEVRINVDE